MRVPLSVCDPTEAHVLCALLRSEGIDAAHRSAGLDVAPYGDFGDWREVLVPRADLERARELARTKTA